MPVSYTHLDVYKRQIFLFSKREDHRMIAKLGAIPALCGISEPVVFGLPLVLNPTFAIPFIFNSGIATAIALFATNIGFMPCNTVDAPFGLPIMIGAFIGHGWQGVVVQSVSYTHLDVYKRQALHRRPC